MVVELFIVGITQICVLDCLSIGIPKKWGKVGAGQVAISTFPYMPQAKKKKVLQG